MMDVRLLAGGAEKHEELTLGEWIQGHLQDSHEWHLPSLHLHLPTFEPVHILGIEVDFSITLHVVMMWIAGLVLLLTFWACFRKRTLVPRGLGAILEVVVLYIRDNVAIPSMGDKNGKKMTPFLSILFFFILTLNLMGLIPLFSTATSNLSVTAGLALVTFCLTQFHGMKENGIVGYFKSLVPGGIPPVLLPIIIPIEIMGLLTKPFALAIRLFANMTAGHTVIYALLGLIIVLGTTLVSPVSVGFAVFINILELLVAFIQAFIFTMLSSLFIGTAMHAEH